MIVTTLAPNGRVLDRFRVRGRYALARQALERVEKRMKLRVETNLGTNGFDTPYGGHEARHASGAMIVVVESRGPNADQVRRMSAAQRKAMLWEYPIGGVTWNIRAALKRSPSARASRVERALFGA